MKLSDFWFRTGTPTYLVRLLSHFKENLNELTGKYYPTSSFLKEYPEDVELARCLREIERLGYLQEVFQLSYFHYFPFFMAIGFKDSR